MEHERGVREHFGVVEPSLFGWAGHCLVCNVRTVGHGCPHEASRALADLCASANVRARRAERAK